MDHNISWLTTVPATDVNFKSHLKMATTEEIKEALQYGTDDMFGLIAVLYQNLWAMADLHKKLKYYEDLEEQGQLLKLPAAIGDEIFCLFMDCPKDYKEEYCRDHEGSCENCHHRVPEIVSRDFRMSDIPNIDRIFATKEEAEAALEEIERGKENGFRT